MDAYMSKAEYVNARTLIYFPSEHGMKLPDIVRLPIAVYHATPLKNAII